MFFLITQETLSSKHLVVKDFDYILLQKVCHAVMTN